MTLRRFVIGLAALIASAPSLAQDTFPTKPIRVIVGYSAGGGNDIIARLIAGRMSEGLGQTVVIENKPGAQSIIAAEFVAKAPADGYTVLMGPSGPMTINPATYAKLPYNALRDFTPLSIIGQFPLILGVSARSPIKTMQELIAFAKANPNEMDEFVIRSGVNRIDHQESFVKRYGRVRAFRQLSTGIPTFLVVRING